MSASMLEETSKSVILDTQGKEEEGTAVVESNSIPVIPELDYPPEHHEGGLKLTDEQVGTKDRLAEMLNMHRTHTFHQTRRNTDGKPGGGKILSKSKNGT